MKKYHFFEDPGHGWLKVSKKELKSLNIADKISAYSYMRGEDVFLEEDQDAPIFCQAKNTPNFFNTYVITHFSDKQSKIRNYNIYINYTEEQQNDNLSLMDKILNLPINWSAKAIKQIKKADRETLNFWRTHYQKQGYII